MSTDNIKMTRRELLAAAGGIGMVASGRAAHSDDPPSHATLYHAPDAEIPGISLRWAFSAQVIFADRFNINAPLQRGYTSVKEGKVWGPRLQGRVLPHSGADYYKGTFNTFYTYEAADGALIFIHNRGSKRRFVAQPPPGQDPVPDANPNPQAPGGWIRFRATPMFTAPYGPHDWMNHTLFLANATKHPDPDRTVFTFYEVL